MTLVLLKMGCKKLAPEYHVQLVMCYNSYVH